MFATISRKKTYQSFALVGIVLAVFIFGLTRIGTAKAQETEAAGETTADGIDPGSEEIDPLDLEADLTFKARHALLISASHYRSGLRGGFVPLPNTNADMRRIAARLKVFDYDSIKIFSDDSLDPLKMPVKKNIEYAIWKLATDAKEDDMLMIVLSGHGVSLGGKSYYVPYDHAKTGMLSLRDFTTSCVSLDQIFAYCSISKAKKIMLVLDACRSALQPQVGGGSVEFFQGIRKVPANTLLLTSCGSQQVARILPLQLNDQTEKEPHSAFLHNFALGLERADIYGGGNNGTLTASELCNYTIQKTRKFVYQVTKQNQTPQIEGSLDSFPIGVYPNTNPYMELKIPIDEQMEVNLDRLIDSGKSMLQLTKPRINRLDLEARYWSEGTRGMSAPRRQQNVLAIALQYGPEGAAMYAAGKLLGERLLQNRPNIQALLHERVVAEVKERLTADLLVDLNYIYNRYFRPDLKTRNSEETHVYCADLFRSAYRYHQTMYHYKQANEEFALHVRVETPIYAEPDKKSEKLGSIGSIMEVAIPTNDEAEKAEAAEATETASESENANSDASQESAEDESTTYQPTEEESEVVKTAKEIIKKESPENIHVTRVIVLEVQGRDLLTLGEADKLQVGSDQWLKIQIVDLGETPKEGWIEAKNAFWSPDLAEHYWISAGLQSPRFRGLYGVVHAREMFIMRSLNIAQFVSSFAGAAGMYVGIANMVAQIARQHIYERVPQYINVRVNAAMKKYEEAGLEGWWSQYTKQLR